MNGRRVGTVVGLGLLLALPGCGRDEQAGRRDCCWSLGETSGTVDDTPPRPAVS